MKANFQHLGFAHVTDSFLCYWVRSPYFGFHWHYHPELEITYVHQGQGVRLVGNNVGHFREGDFVLLGSNLPHTWISDDDFNQGPDQMEVVVLQFPPQLFSETWLDIPEMANLQRLLKNGGRGISFSTPVKEQAAQILIKMTEQNGFERFQQLMNLLHLLGSDNQPEYLASAAFTPSLNQATEQRLLKVCQYIHDQFTEPIRLDEVAALAHMNATSFCRFFRHMTGQTLMEYVIDLRIGKACNLLIDSNKKSISEIAYLSGFQSQTLFNRKFLQKKGMTPRVFRQQFE